MSEWIAVADRLPEEHKPVFTKIDDEAGCRNEAMLYRDGRLWFVPGGSVYVYYTPTHWRYADEDVKEAAHRAAGAISAIAEALRR